MYLSYGSTKKASGPHSDEIARCVDNSKCDETTKEYANGADDAENDSQYETGDETLDARAPTQRGIVHDARQTRTLPPLTST